MQRLITVNADFVATLAIRCGCFHPSEIDDFRAETVSGFAWVQGFRYLNRLDSDSESQFRPTQGFLVPSIPWH